jgi:hypothetical protein
LKISKNLPSVGMNRPNIGILKMGHIMADIKPPYCTVADSMSHF